MACAGQSVTAHTAIVFFLISSLSVRCQTYNHIARTDIGIVYNNCALHAAGHCRVYDNGTYKVAHIGCFATGGINAYSHFAEFGKQFIRTVDDG